MRKICISKRRGQVWVETVIYTLIGLTIIGLLLSVAKPQLDKQKDKALIEQAIQAVGQINQKIGEVVTAGPANTRKLDIKIGSGELMINAQENKIEWTLPSEYQYSELNTNIQLGEVSVITREKSPYEVTLSIEYPYDIQVDGQDENKIFAQASVPQSITIEHAGIENKKVILNIHPL